MSFTIPQQVQQLIQDKKNILITFRKDAAGDSIASALTLLLFLQKLGKPADIVCDEFTVPKAFHFLKGSTKIQSHFTHLQNFIITLDVKEAGVQELSYDLKEEKLRIFITPKHGFLTRNHVRTAQTDFKYDLIFIVDTQDLESLGGLYDNNTELFYKTPIINIDRDPGNEHFGQVNVIDLTVTSTAEVLFDLLKKLGEAYIDTDIATALLTGLIAKTRSFKAPNIKPYTLATASKLVSLGANREHIVQNLYRTRSIATLKLWGAALTHMQHDKTTGLVWSTITREDFVRAGAVEDDLKDIVDELISTSPEAKVTLLLHEEIGPDQGVLIHGIIQSTKDKSAKMLVQKYQPTGGDEQASFIMKHVSLKVAEEQVTQDIKTALEQKI